MRCTRYEECFCSGARNIRPIEKSFAQQETKSEGTLLMRTLPHVPIFQNAYKSYRMSFFLGSKNAQSPVRGGFRCRVGVGQ